MHWFPFQGIMLYKENNIKSPADHLKSLLKVFLMFKISIWYNNTITTNIVPEAFGIKYINRGKIIGYY